MFTKECEIAPNIQKWILRNLAKSSPKYTESVLFFVFFLVFQSKADFFSHDDRMALPLGQNRAHVSVYPLYFVEFSRFAAGTTDWVSISICSRSVFGDSSIYQQSNNRCKIQNQVQFYRTTFANLLDEFAEICGSGIIIR